jgi:hypothetical protein
VDRSDARETVVDALSDDLVVVHFMIIPRSPVERRRPSVPAAQNSMCSIFAALAPGRDRENGFCMAAF